MRGAMRDADVVGGRLRRAGGEVDKLRQDLERAGKHLRAGAKAQAELVHALGTETPELKTLGDRLTDLNGAVRAADKALTGGEWGIRDALGATRRLMDSNLQADRAGTARKLATAHAEVRGRADALGASLSKASATLAGVERARGAAMEESAALAVAGDTGTLAKSAAERRW